MPLRTPGLLSVLLALTVAVCIARPARAALQFPYGKLICQDDRALITFTAASNSNTPQFPPIPDGLPSFDAEPVEGNECTLADGRDIRVKIGTREQTPWGECGAALDTYASVWIDHRKVISRRWVQHTCFMRGETFRTSSFWTGRG